MSSVRQSLTQIRRASIDLAQNNPNPARIREICIYIDGKAKDVLDALNAAEIDHIWEYPTGADAYMVPFRLIRDDDA